VATILAEAFPDETWECSHLGGDRFAATLIIFPEGLYYGRASVGDAPGLVERYRHGVIDPRTFRGRSSSPNVVQAAESAARAHTGDERIAAFVHRSTVPESGGWTVTFAHGAEDVVVRVVASESSPLLTTCEATVALPVRQFQPLSVAIS
jgi:hypothetical protein